MWINILNLLGILRAIITWGFNISEELPNSSPQDLSLAPSSLWLTRRIEFPHQVLLQQTSHLPFIKRCAVMKQYRRKQMQSFPSLRETKHLLADSWIFGLFRNNISKNILFFSLTGIYHTRHGCISGASQVALLVKNRPANAGDIRNSDSIPGLGRSPGGGHSNPLQYSCLENPLDRGAWWATVHGVAKRQTWVKGLSTHTPMHFWTAERKVGHVCPHSPYLWKPV